MGFGAGGEDIGYKVVADTAGNVYVTGYFEGSVDFDPGPNMVNLTSAGEQDAFVAKYTATGTLVWARQLGGSNSDEGRGIAVDAAGNVYTTGFFFGMADFDPGPGTGGLTSAGGADQFVSKLDSAGNYLWARRLGGGDNDSADSIGVDAAGNVYTAGIFREGTVDFGPGPGAGSFTGAGQSDWFLSKLDSAGNYLWVRGFGGSGFDGASALAVDAAGNTYTTGGFQGAVDFDPGLGTYNLTSVADIGDAFISKLDSAGNFVWARQWNGSPRTIITAIALDSSGSIYTTGTFQGTVDFDPGPGTSDLTSAGDFDVFVNKLDTAGDFLWASQWGGTSHDQADGIAVDGHGNVYTTGMFVGTADFDPGPGTFNLTSAGDRDVFVSELDSAGNYLGASQFGGSGEDFGVGIAVDGGGNVYTTGYFNGTADFDPGPGTYTLTSAGGADIFVAQFVQTRPPGFPLRLGGTGSGLGLGVATDAAGNVYVTGHFEGTVNFDPGPNVVNLISSGGSDAFVAKYTAAGALVWADRLGGTSGVQGYGIAVDTGGNVYTTGYFNGTTDFDPGPGTYNLTSAGLADVFVSKLDRDGHFVWVRRMGGGDEEVGLGIALDSGSNVYTTGYFKGTANFGTGNLISAGPYSAFVSKLDSGGHFIWADQLSGSKDVFGAGIAVDSDTNVSVTGDFAGTADFNPGPGTSYLTSAGLNDAFVTKLDKDGHFIWARQSVASTTLTSGGSGGVLGIAVDGAGNVYSTGAFAGTANFGSGNVTSSVGSLDIYVSKLDRDGHFIWARQLGGIGHDEGSGIAVDETGNVYTTGYFQGTVAFGAFTLTSAGSSGAFVTKMDANGQIVSASQLGDATDAYGRGIAVDGAGDVYSTGYLTGTGGSFDIFLSRLRQSCLFSPFVSVPVGSDPFAVATGDFNGDSKQDFATANFGGATVSVMLGNGDGTFRQAPGSPLGLRSGATSLAVADFNGDGLSDIAVGNNRFLGNTMNVFLANATRDGTFHPAPGSPYTVGVSPLDIAVADFNGDGVPDLVNTNENSASVSVLIGTGTGGFNPAINTTIGPYPEKLAVGDFNGDRKQDVVVFYRDSNVLDLLLGDGTGRFLRHTGPAVGYSMRLAVGDFNADGKQDLAVGSIPLANPLQSSVSILIGDGAGGFRQAAGSPYDGGGGAIVVADFDRDGKQDLGLATGTSDSSSATGGVLLGVGDGRFVAAPCSPFAVGSGARSLAAADFNGDGRPDLVVAESDATNNVSVLLSHSITFNAAADFSASANPNGPWQYGWSATLGSSFNPDTRAARISGLDFWQGIPNSDEHGNPSVSHNGSASPITIHDTTWQAGQLAFHPGPSGQYSIVRWTAPTAGTVQLRVAFSGLTSTTTDVHVLHEGVSIFDGFVTGSRPGPSFSQSLLVKAQDTIDFTVGFGANASYSSDTTGLDATLTLDSSLQEPPTLSAIPDQITNEDAPTSSISFTVADAETDAGSLMVAGTAENQPLVPDGNIVFGGSGSNRTVIITPAPNLSGSTTITVTATDGSGATTPATFHLTVNPVNDAPSFTKGADQTANEDASRQTVRNWATNILASPPDEASQTLTFHVTGDTNPGLFAIPPSIDLSGTLTYTLAGNQPGSAMITVVLQDNGGTANGGVDTSPPVTFTITAKQRQIITVITEGWQLYLGIAPLPDWISEMATAINAQLPSDQRCDPATIPDARVKEGDPPMTTDCPGFLLLNWDSFYPGSGHRKSAEDTLLSWLTYRLNQSTGPVDLHFIGHSRGAVVNSDVVERLEGMQAKIHSLQMTMLDPHPSQKLYYADPTPVVPTDFIWEGGTPTFGDDYYETIDVFTGIPVQGALNLDITDQLQGWNGRTGLGRLHQEAHDWYQWTIDTDDTSNDPLIATYNAGDDKTFYKEHATFVKEAQSATGATRHLLYGTTDLDKNGIPEDYANGSKIGYYWSVAGGGIAARPSPTILADGDTDGISNAVEDGAPNGDGDNDGIKDSQEDNVASFPIKASYITIASPTGTELYDVLAFQNYLPAPPPAGALFPVGLLQFKVRGVISYGLLPGSATVQIILPPGTNLNSYYKYGSTPDNQVLHWYNFVFNPATGTGAEIHENIITLHFVDSYQGDDDLEKNGEIIDPGFPALLEGPVLTGLNLSSASIEEGMSVTLSGAFADPRSGGLHSANIEWGDGTSTVASVPAGTLGFELSHRFTDNPSGGQTANYINVTLSDLGDGLDVASTVVAVKNVAPVAVLLNGGPVVFGAPVVASFSEPADASPEDTSAGFHYAFAVDSDSLTTATYAGSESRTSAEFLLGAGNHVIFARIIDKDDGYTEYQTIVIVNPATPVITWMPPGDIVYGTPLSSAQLNASASVPGVFVYTIGSVPSSGVVLHAGDGQILSASFMPDDSTDYTSASASVAINVLQKDLTIAADNQSMIYGGTPPVLRASYSGLVNGDTPANFTTPPTLATVPASSQVGSYDITVGGATDPDYLISYSTGTLTITPALLTVSADNKCKVYGQANPPPTTSYSGFVNGDGPAALGGAPALEMAASLFSSPGTYAITAQPGTLSAHDYVFQFVNGTLTVNKASTSTMLSVVLPTLLFGVDTETFTASVSVSAPGSGTPTGSFAFYDATTGTDLGMVLLINGTASLNTASLGTGQHAITATFQGDGNFLSSTASATLEVIPPASLSGSVFADFNDDGQVDFGERGIPGVSVRLTGTDDLGHALNRTLLTDGDGAYIFNNLRPGSYYLTKTSQPAGYTSGIDSVGTAGGSLLAADEFFLQLARGINGLNYNYGERPAATGQVHRGQTAGIGFWNNRNGQALILAFNGGSGTQLGDWLAATFPNLYGAGGGSNNLRGRSNAFVAALFQSDFLVHGMKLDAQVLATALSVYATNATLDSTRVATQYGFTVSGDGVGTATFNVGRNGDAFGVANNTILTVMDLLLAADAQAVRGVLYNGDVTKRNEANDVFSALNQAGSIG